MLSAIAQRQLSPSSTIVDSDSPEEVLCNLKDIVIPVDNNIVFGVDSDNDTIIVNDPGCEPSLGCGDR